jgi:2,3-bisphosphoglycerate-independent phosphoglycerate mutase
MLSKFNSFPGIEGPVVTIVLDGYGLNANTEGNAIYHAKKPILDQLFKKYSHVALKAHGVAVGLPSDDDMGNSEVGHNAIGAGQVYSQGAALVNKAIETGAIYESTTWKNLIDQARKNNGTLHFLGLFSDGNVHSHIDHLKSMIVRAKKEGLPKVRIHILLDGRDVSSTSALDYVLPFEQTLRELNDATFNARIASGGGRMVITMDRYEAEWGMVEKGWKTHVLGEADHFDSAQQAIESARNNNPKIGDQDLPPFVITEKGEPIGKIVDGDSVVFFNFRGDRAIEISMAFESTNFKAFDRIRVPKVAYAGMLQYDGDAKVPANFLVSPPSIRNTLGEKLAMAGLTQLAISETQKYGHVTYFWNGNRSGKFDDAKETYIEIPSDVIPFEQRPWMKAAEITDRLIQELKTGKYRSARVNYANGDMVGHTGDFRAAVVSVEVVDMCLSRLLPVIDALKGVAIITADHGNADEMYELDKKTKQPIVLKDGSIKCKTSHTLNPVPCILYDNVSGGKLSLKNGNYGLSNIAATNLNLLGLAAPENWDESILVVK